MAPGEVWREVPEFVGCVPAVSDIVAEWREAGHGVDVRIALFMGFLG